jgi:GntR family transcriptional repressor for pyruvate dehydrogenase complex
VADPPRGEDRSKRHSNVINFPDIEPLTITRLADSVADRIRRMIVAENIGEGARLPSERVLAERFGASRPTISQALRNLSLMGLVDIRRGSGAYVLRRPDTGSVGDMMQLRLWLETLGVERAASRKPKLSAAEVDAISSALSRLELAASSPDRWIAADTFFHATVIQSAGNPYLAAVYEAVHTAIVRYEFTQWIEDGTVPAWLLGSGPVKQMALHRPIAEAVVARDIEGARTAVLAHHKVMLQHVALLQGTAGSTSAS